MRSHVFRDRVNKRYNNMISRCYSENDVSYKNYGGRGILVTEKWLKSFEDYYKWFVSELERLGIEQDDFMKNTRDISVDRKDVHGHYTEENCQLNFGHQFQCRNKQNSKKRLLTTAEGTEILV